MSRFVKSPETSSITNVTDYDIEAEYLSDEILDEMPIIEVLIVQFRDPFDLGVKQYQASDVMHCVGPSSCKLLDNDIDFIVGSEGTKLPAHRFIIAFEIFSKCEVFLLMPQESWIDSWSTSQDT